MKVFVPAETLTGEKRVALVPEAVAKLIKLGLEVSIETNAGHWAEADDYQYSNVGAKVIPTSAAAGELASADVVATVRPLDPARVGTLKADAITVSFLSPTNDLETIKALSAAKATSLSFELVPRISRAQSMDALTSQALCAGYRCVLIAAEKSSRFFPMLMTAAGTVQPTKVLVLGAGVAGLQAMATARRLGAVVSAYDVRSSSADEVKSMGATFIDLGLDALEGSGGYAREMAQDRAVAQQEALKPHVAAADVVITTAAVPGRRAPLLLTSEMVSGMKAGSIIVDLAAETGGNVEGSVAGEEVLIAAVGGHVKLIGGKDVPSQLAVHSSKLYAQNIVSLLSLITKDGEVVPDLSDEVIAGSALVYAGEVRNPVAREQLGLPALAETLEGN
ncbi:MAG: NAD(P) transhydrogenase subunit alpha [Actinobacteria bacterium]|nr:NAD(P) transhydrogenase subunit alpha [Actinomycetota bacterium]NBY14879.1 NAD(P) transhydrogenase subunit alpha [Actinomycetota bacterium]